MADRRMLSKQIIDSDAFLSMPVSTQALYFHLCMRADDDGFINSPKSIQRMVCATDDDFKVLLAKRFLIPFESGVVVIKHWRIHNYIQNDRYKETAYIEEKKRLAIKPNKAYTLIEEEPAMLIEASVNDAVDEQPEEKKQPKKRQSDILDELDKYGLPTSVREAMVDFIDMRKAKKRPLTARALKMAISKLFELSKDEKTQIAIIEQSIYHNWDGLFAVKKESTFDDMTVRGGDTSAWEGLGHL